MVWSDPCTEVSQTANTCTDTSTRLSTGLTGTAYGGITNGMSKPRFTKSKTTVVGYVDAAGIGRRLFTLPGEVSLFI